MKTKMFYNQISSLQIITNFLGFNILYIDFQSVFSYEIIRSGALIWVVLLAAWYAPQTLYTVGYQFCSKSIKAIDVDNRTAESDGTN